MKIMKLRQNAMKKPRQNVVKNEILPELLSIKTQYGLQAKRNGGLEQKAMILKQNASSEDAVADDAGKKITKELANEAALDNLLVQQKEGYANSSNRDTTVSPPVSAIGQSFDNVDLPTDSLMLDLEDTADLLNTGIFSDAYDDEDEGAEADLNNLETTMNFSHVPKTIIHKDHHKDQIIGDINSATQTRRMTKIFEEHALLDRSNARGIDIVSIAEGLDII
ncbi:hypothetical protein Tco_0634930 [Tanacetum coccineum]